MLRNYIKIALRNVFKHKGYAAINIVGLAIGMAACILITLFVRNELQYDHFHDDADGLYRAWVHENYGEGQQFFNTVTPLPLGPALAAAYPEVEQYVRVHTFGDLVAHQGTQFTEAIHMVDPNFFAVFNFPLLQGDPATVFAEPNTVVLTETLAQRYFGDQDPVGQTLSIRLGGSDFEALVVTGVAADVPTASSIQFGIAIPFEKGLGNQWSERMLQAWFNVAPETYIRLRPDADPAALAAKFPTMVADVLGDQVQAGQYTIGLQPMTDIHLNPDMPQGIAPVSDPAYAFILAAIAAFVLLIACINFMTLSIGQSTRRALEVGVRKVVGAGRRQLMGQFWGEALLTTTVALVLGLALAQGFLPLFNDLAGQRLTLDLDGGLLLAIGLLITVVGLIAGIYPALVLSSFRPIEVLKGQLSVGGGTGLLRRTLIVVQFGLSIFLITSTLLMREQLSYLQARNLGFDKEQVVVIPTGVPPDEGLPLVERFRNELAGQPAVLSVAAARYAFASGSWMQIGYDADDGTYRSFNVNVVDHDYLRTLGIEMVQGRDFSRDITADEMQGILVNEAMVAEYGWADPLTAQLPGGFGDHQIIGVVKDFNYASQHTAVQPLALVLNFQAIRAGISDVSSGQSAMPKMMVRIEPGGLPDALGLLERTWATVAPGQDFTFTFLDEAVDSQYRQEQRLGQMVGIASLLSVLIACLGLFGLAALTVVRRTKEIGVRKVMGASAGQIVMLLSRDFTVLVAVAFLLAIPATYLFVDPWLQNFAYRVALNPLLFLAAGLLMLAVAWLTVSYQSIKAARANPVDSLRYE